jgi:hypothetical protein
MQMSGSGLMNALQNMLRDGTPASRASGMRLGCSTAVASGKLPATDARVGIRPGGVRTTRTPREPPGESFGRGEGSERYPRHPFPADATTTSAGTVTSDNVRTDDECRSPHFRPGRHY